MHVVHITRGVGIGWYTKEVIKKEGFNKQQQQEWQKRIADKEAAYKEIYDRLASTCQHTRTGIRRGPIAMAACLAGANPKVLQPGVKPPKKP